MGREVEGHSLEARCLFLDTPPPHKHTTEELFLMVKGAGIEECEFQGFTSGMWVLGEELRGGGVDICIQARAVRLGRKRARSLGTR